MIDDVTIDPSTAAIRRLVVGKMRGEVLTIRSEIAENLERLRAADPLQYAQSFGQSFAGGGSDPTQLPSNISRHVSQLAFLDSILQSDDLKFCP